VRKFGILVSGLILTSIALIIVARVLGSFSPRSASYTALFVNHDGSTCDRPCMFGIEPGQTPFNDAVVTLKSLPLIGNMQSDLSSSIDWMWVKSRDLYVRVNRYENVSIVASSELYLTPLYSLDNEPSIKTSLGETIVQRGIPAFVRLEVLNGTPVTVLYYQPNIRLVFRRQNPNYVGVDDPFLGLSLYTDLPDLQGWSSPWNGFNTVRHYLDLMAGR
jgi:hypothetical protein